MAVQLGFPGVEGKRGNPKLSDGFQRMSASVHRSRYNEAALLPEEKAL
ncbi:hypothetical protein Sj15T_15860 [Sphingobium sp. TA15]|nr:hypothetical protein M527_08370 [Sphingobium indicum IP26]EQB06960.1 hypothetical protein L286_04965 [Sphingobium sp. HDIP04]BDD66565.1 hypothetical protein Sj15T_15860 [Sphingobium sp. TA15]